MGGICCPGFSRLPSMSVKGRGLHAGSAGPRADCEAWVGRAVPSHSALPRPGTGGGPTAGHARSPGCALPERWVRQGSTKLGRSRPVGACGGPGPGGGLCTFAMAQPVYAPRGRAGRGPPGRRCVSKPAADVAAVSKQVPAGFPTSCRRHRTERQEPGSRPGRGPSLGVPGFPFSPPGDRESPPLLHLPPGQGRGCDLRAGDFTLSLVILLTCLLYGSQVALERRAGFEHKPRVCAEAVGWAGGGSGHVPAWEARARLAAAGGGQGPSPCALREAALGGGVVIEPRASGSGLGEP